VCIGRSLGMKAIGAFEYVPTRPGLELLPLLKGGSGTVRPTMFALMRAVCASSRAPRWWALRWASTIVSMSKPQSRAR
jgi:hypothetical protein